MPRSRALFEGSAVRLRGLKAANAGMSMGDTMLGASSVARAPTHLQPSGLAEDDGEQEKEEPLGRIQILSRQLAPDHLWREDPKAGRHWGTWQGSPLAQGRVQHEDLNTSTRGQSFYYSQVASRVTNDSLSKSLS